MATTSQQLVDRATAHIDDLAPCDVEAHLLAQDATVIDIREPAELGEHGHIAGAVHVPRGLLEFWADPASAHHRPELDPQRHTIVYCSTGNRSALAAGVLQELGYRQVSRLAGGIVAWKRAALPVAGLERWHDLADVRR